jgi:pantoate--beta-alanine ligase
MIVTRQPEELRAYLDQARQAGKRVGFHPTMGALHKGHRANIRKACSECDVVAVSIFVNPLQFGPTEDFQSYPRDLDGDLAQAEQAGATVVLAPPPEAMFPEPPLTTVRVQELSDRWEGAVRRGHMEGVATVVTKLFAIAGPCLAYFGEKDYQQLAVVRRLVSDLSLPVTVVACPTVRETDGLAVSSRNAYLGPAERSAATVLYWSLLAGKRAIEERAVTDPSVVRDAMVQVASAQELFEIDYAEVVDPRSLEVPRTVSGEVRLLIAGRLGRARLIDNVGANSEGG